MTHHLNANFHSEKSDQAPLRAIAAKKKIETKFQNSGLMYLEIDLIKLR